MRNLISLVLGGGKGTRLLPLTTYRSKPAVPLAGKYRLIDIPISNCINSGVNKIYLLTQFNSVSLHRHIRQHREARRKSLVVVPSDGGDPRIADFHRRISSEAVADHDPVAACA